MQRPLLHRVLHDALIVEALARLQLRTKPHAHVFRGNQHTEVEILSDTKLAMIDALVSRA